MAQLQLQAVAALQASRAGTVGNVGEKQTGMVEHEQNTRESVSKRAQGIFDTAQKAVDQLLQPLPKTAIARWEAGLTKLSQAFHDSLNRVKKWIDERHEGVGGTILAIGDYIGGLPDWVTDEYNRAERDFGDGVGELLLSISSDVNGVIAAAQALVEGARRDIDAAFTEMAAEFPEWAAQEKARFSGLLDGLGAKVTQAQTSFVKDISNRAVTAVNEAHAEVEAKRQEAGGLIGRVVAAIEEFIEDPVRAIINGLLRLVGIPPSAFWALIEKIAQVISDIADDPENFVNNLVEGLKQGFQAFFDNFGQHVLKGFWDWLFSGLETPIPMPKDMSASALFSFALQLMGITWPRVREILVKHIGPTAVEVIEAAWQLISVLIERGPEGLVELVKEQLTPENIVNTILEAAVQYLVETLIKQVIIRVIGMLNPVGAIAQAIDLIYQVCKWIFNNAARIFRFIEAVVNGLADVVAGNVGGLAKKVEQGLAMLIPPVIDFLAGLLHLGDLPNEIAEVINKLQAMVLKVMDRVIGFLAERGKALLKKMGLGGDEKDEGKGDEELGSVVRFSAAGESHRLFVQREGAQAELMVASVPTTIPDWITRWKGMLEAGKPAEKTPERAEAELLLGQLGPEAATAEAAATALVAGFEAAERVPASDPAHKKPPDDSGVESAEKSIATKLDRLFTIFGEDDAKKWLGEIRVSLPNQGGKHTETVLDSWRGKIEPVLAKPIMGKQGQVWNGSEFTAAALTPTEVLTANANHAALLPFYEEKPRKGSDTDEFRTYALVRGDSPVRPKFFRSLGGRAAAKLRTDGATRLDPTGDSRLLENIRRISYDYDPGGYGTFTPWPDSPVSTLIVSTVAGAGGPLNTLRSFVNQQTVGGVTYVDFAAELKADSKANTWLADQLRNISTGQHEWLPVSIGAEVLEHAVQVGLTDIKKGLGWIALLESLRTPTNTVLWQIVQHPVIVAGTPSQEGPQPAPRGHVASLSLDPDTLVQDGLTTGTGDFHDALRDFFRNNKAMHPAAWVDALLAHLPTVMWTGSNVPIPTELLNRPIGVFYAMPSGFAGGLTVAQVMAEQRKRWEQIEAAFLAAKSRIK